LAALATKTMPIRRMNASNTMILGNPFRMMDLLEKIPETTA
jgi:hypothetical protein